MLHGILKACTVLSLLSPAPAVAQSAEACAPEEVLLMYCSFDRGAKQVGLCLSDDSITYRFGADFNAPELTLTSLLTDLDDAPYRWSGYAHWESVLLRNVDTTYELYMTLPREPSERDTTQGGIIITNPDLSQTEIRCHYGSVEPQRPPEGIGQLTPLVTDGNDLILRSCLDQTDDATLCLGTVQAAEVAGNGCVPGQDLTDCWAAEAAAWERIMDRTFTTAQADVARISYDHNRQSLQPSQDSWNETRNLDCRLLSVLPFAGDGGFAKCSAEYTAKRLQVLRDIVAISDFDG